MSQISTVTRLDARKRRARRDFDGLMALAQIELGAIAGGDLAGFWGLHRAVNQALGLELEHRLDAEGVAC